MLDCSVFRRAGSKKDITELGSEAIPALKLKLVCEMPVGAPVNWYCASEINPRKLFHVDLHLWSNPMGQQK